MALKKHSILLVEDEENLHEALKLNLELEGYDVSGCFDGPSALKKIHQEHFDAMILDIMLPEIDGIEVCETIRVQNINIPILMLSAKNSSADRVLGLRKGADDYLVKPFNLEELLIRVRNMIEKNELLSKLPKQSDFAVFGKNKIDFNGLTCINFKGESFSLSKKEAMLLKLLIENKNEVVTREKILQTVWGYQVYPNTRTVDNFILNFRKYFEADSRNPEYFQSIRGVGYKFTLT